MKNQRAVFYSLYKSFHIRPEANVIDQSRKNILPGTASSKQHFLRGSLLNIFADGLIPLVGMFISIYLIRRLAPEGYGLYTLAVTLVALVEKVLISLWNRQTIKQVSETENWHPAAKTAFYLFTGSGLLFCAILILVSPALENILDVNGLQAVLMILTLEVPLFAVSQSIVAIQTAKNVLHRTALLGAVRWVGRLIFIILFVENGLSVHGAVLGIVTACLLETIVALPFGKRFLSSNIPRLPFQQFYKAAVHIFLFEIAFFLLMYSDIYLLKFAGIDIGQVGIYAAAKNIGYVPYFLSFSFSSILLSTLGNLKQQENSAEAIRVVASQALRLCILGLPFCAIAAGASGEIIELLYGDAYQKAAPLLSLLIIGGNLLVIGKIASVILISCNHLQSALKSLIVLLIGVWIGLPWIIPQTDLFGTALFVTTILFICTVYLLVLTCKYSGVLPPSLTLLRSSIIAFLAFWIATWSVPGFLLPAKLLLICLAVVFLLRITREIQSADIDFIQSIWRRTP